MTAARGSPRWDGVARDVRHGLRSLRSTPAFTTIALLCLAIGIGANTTMFGVADRLFLRPPAGVRDPNGVVRLYLDRRTGSVRSPGGGQGSFPDYADLRAGARHAFAGVAAYTMSAFSYGVGATARQWQGQYVTAGYFPVLGTRPELGRFFLPEEDSVVGAHPVTVLSYASWQRDFGGDPHVIGRVIELDAHPYTVVGVAQRGFSGFDLQALDVWVPMAQVHGMIGPEAMPERHAIWLDYVARLAPGASRQQAASEATAVKRHVDAVAAPDLDRNVRVIAGPLLAALGPSPGASASIALWVSGAVAFVLLIACANVANLLLARGAGRSREFAIGRSLGATRWQLVRQLMVESLILAMVGGALGLLLALWGSGSVQLFALPPSAAGLDTRALLFAAGVALSSAVAAGLAPALLTTRASDLGVGRDAAQRGSPGLARLHGGLLVLQAALSLIVLAGAGLFVRSVRNIHAVDLGLDARHVLTATVDLGSAGYDSATRVALFDRLVERLTALPGIRAVAYEGLPPFQAMIGLAVRVPGRDTVNRDRRGTFVNFVGPNFLRANGTPLLRGRDISAADRAGTLPVAIVNVTMARRLWPAQEALGQCMRVSTFSAGPPGTLPCTYVVGVMGDGKYESITEDPTAYFLLPYAQRDPGVPPTLVVRAAGDPHDLVAPVRQAIAAMAPSLPYVDVRPLGDALEPQFQPYEVGAALFTIFGAVALALAAVGLYGVVSYVVTQRTRESGIRLALGAHEWDVVALMLRRGLLPAIAGGAVGIVGALIVTRIFENQLYQVSPTDPATFTVVALLLAGVAALACYVPARRASRVDPVTALRSE